MDAAAAFGADTPAPDPEAPATFGALMAWVSGQTAGGHLTPDQVTLAYADTGISMSDQLPPSDEATITERVAKLYVALSA